MKMMRNFANEKYLSILLGVFVKIVKVKHFSQVVVLRHEK